MVERSIVTLVSYLKLSYDNEIPTSFDFLFLIIEKLENSQAPLLNYTCLLRNIIKNIDTSGLERFLKGP